MDEENKVEQTKTEETKVVEKTEDKKSFGSLLKDKFQACRAGECKCGKKKWLIGAIIVLVIAVAGSYLYKIKKTDIGVEGARSKVQQFIKDNTPQGGAGITIKDVTKDSGLYKVTIDANKQEIVAYVTTDGSKFFPQAIDLNTKAAAPADDSAAAPEKTEAENKTDVPTVDLFVMSYCPYGLQMEKGLLPAVEALGNKIKFNLKFVSYTLHGPKEVAENLNQYCIEKTQPTKLDNYLKCFWKDSKGSSDACMKTVGINTAQVTSCVADATKQFNPTEKAFDINKDENVKFGVQGSPTLVVNGTTVASGRDSASVLKAICSGFTTQPKECQAKLSATSPSAGFDDQAAAAAGGSAPAASCATPQN
ncbi:MAG: hypothetical protein PHW24_04820 [Candidatus Moranbacteria bacterium]|nr:hypothetical protein [Candidatus Moranbacteria bacterium]